MVINVNRYLDLALSADLFALSFLTSTTTLSTLTYLLSPSLIFLSIFYLSSGPQTKTITYIHPSEVPGTSRIGVEWLGAV